MGTPIPFRTMLDGAGGGVMHKFWRDYNLSIVLFALFFVSWVLQGAAQWFEMANEAQAHGKMSTLPEFLAAFLSATFENWQSEFLQLFTFVVLTTFLIHKGSHESKDTDEKVNETLARIEARLGQLERGEAAPRVTTRRYTNGRHANGHAEDDDEAEASGRLYARGGAGGRPELAPYSAPSRP
jgi:hypothetical protein